MINMQKWTRNALIGFILSGASGCETLDTVKDVFSDPIILACPDYRVLADASEIIHYLDGGGRDLTDVVFEGEIRDLRLECLTKIDKKTRVGIMEVEVSLIIDASRGPADRSRKAIYPYFIIITDLNKKIVYREELKIGISFSGNRSKLSFSSNPITLELPLRPKFTGDNYLIYSGFILTREQLKHHRLRHKQRKY
jgi:hypothetical protein